MGRHEGKKKKDLVVRENFKKNELRFIEYKYLQKEAIYLNDIFFKYFLHYKFLKWFRVVKSQTRIRNLCIKTGKARWVLRRFLVSRIVFKEYMRYGKLQGVRK